MLKWTLRCAGFAALAFLAACETTPKDEDITLAVMPDGRFAALDAKGRPSTDPTARMLAELMNQQAGADVEPLAEDEIWRTESGGHLTHIQSGGQCPATWASLRRDKTHVYVPDGTNVGCNYTNQRNAYVTVYYYRGDPDVTVELKGAFDSMKQRQPVSDEVRFTDESAAYKARTLAYKAADGVAMRTSVLVSQSGGWTLKLRITCSAADAAVVERAAGLGLIGQSDRLAKPLTPPGANAAAPI